MIIKTRTVTRNEVARAAGVSSATISYVVNNGPRPVAPETRQRVLETIQRLGYHPNLMARNLRLQHSSTIGLIVPDIHNPYFAEVARGVEQMAAQNGLTMVLCHSNYELEQELHYVKILQMERSAGVIWFPATNSAEPAKQLSSYGMPVVVLDRIISGVRVPSVTADNFRGGYLATQHLIALGHRTIGCITRPTELEHSSERIRGFRAAMKENHLQVDESLLVGGGFRLEDGRIAATQLIKRTPRPSAIFTYNDFMGIGALRAAYELGLKIPEDISIVGFDDIPQSAFTCPALTTISQPKLEMGRQGFSLLLEEMKEPMFSNDPIPPLPVKLIVRESTGPCSQ